MHFDKEFLNNLLSMLFIEQTIKKDYPLELVRAISNTPEAGDALLGELIWILKDFFVRSN